MSGWERRSGIENTGRKDYLHGWQGRWFGGSGGWEICLGCLNYCLVLEMPNGGLMGGMES